MRKRQAVEVKTRTHLKLVAAYGKSQVTFIYENNQTGGYVLFVLSNPAL